MPFVLSDYPPADTNRVVEDVFHTYKANGFIMEEELQSLMQDPKASIHCLLAMLSNSQAQVTAMKGVSDTDRMMRESLEISLRERNKELMAQKDRADLAISLISEVQKLKERIDVMLYPLRQLSRMGRHTTHVCEANLHLLAAGIEDYIEGNG